LPVGVDDAGFEERGIHALAFAGLQLSRIGGHDAEGRQDPRGYVGDRRADFHRRPSMPFAGDRHQAGHALRDEVEAAAVGIGPGPPEAGHLAVDEPGIVPTQRLVAEAEPLHRALPIILDHHVRLAQKPPQRVLRRRLLQVEHDAALVAVHHHEGCGFAVDVRRQETPAVVALGLLHLDDVGTHVG
jgi:hypothetical protein